MSIDLSSLDLTGIDLSTLPPVESRGRGYRCGPIEDADHFVYRCYDVDGVLLYIGCTTDVPKRLKGHFTASASTTTSWWLSLFYADHTIEGPFRGRDAGRAAESAAIRDEFPIFNQQSTGLPRHQVLQRAATYLVEHDHRSLAIDTCCICITAWIVERRLCRAHFHEVDA